MIRNWALTVVVLVLAWPALAQVTEQQRSAGIDRRANSICAILGVDDAARQASIRGVIAEYYTADQKQVVVYAKLAEHAPVDKVEAAKPYIAQLLAMPLTGREKGLLTEQVDYTKVISGRADRIVDTLGLTDKEKAEAVHELIMNQYRVIQETDAVRDAKLKSADKAAADGIKAEHLAVRKILHDAYLTSLAKYLTPEQIEKVKDGHTPNKVQFTFTGYQNEYPDMTDAQKAKVLELLKEARELAMDGGDSKEKDAIFNKYKGKINNWLSSQGVKSKKQQQKEAASKPAT